MHRNHSGFRASVNPNHQSLTLWIGRRRCEGLLRRTKNLCLGSLIEAVRDQTRRVDLKQVNRVLVQPHWRKDCDQPIV
jgi:hypothetical protein